MKGSWVTALISDLASADPGVLVHPKQNGHQNQQKLRPCSLRYFKNYRVKQLSGHSLAVDYKTEPNFFSCQFSGKGSCCLWVFVIIKWSAEHYNNKHHKTQQPLDKCELETKFELVKWIAKVSRWKRLPCSHPCW